MAPEVTHLLRAAVNLLNASDAPKERVRVGSREFHLITERHERYGWIVLLMHAPDCVPSDYTLKAVYGLTDRQCDVARHLMERLSNREIAERLGVAETTANCHTTRVLKKLGVKSRIEIRDKLLRGKPDE